MKTVSAVLVLIGALAPFGCAPSPGSFNPSRLSRVNLGMAKEAVVDRLGPPLHAATSEEGLEVFRYAERSPAGSATNFYGVLFKEGRVVEYGAEAGARLGGRFAVRDLFDDSWMQLQPLQPSTPDQSTP